MTERNARRATDRLTISTITAWALAVAMAIALAAAAGASARPIPDRMARGPAAYATGAHAGLARQGAGQGHAAANARSKAARTPAAPPI